MTVTSLVCPKCGAKGEKSLPPHILLSENPQIRSDILSGAFFEWECPSCKTRYFFDGVFLYNDDIRRFMVYLVADTKKRLQPVPTAVRAAFGSGVDTSTLRLTSSFPGFVEKIRILESGLDDRIVEAVKTVYAQAHSQALGQTVCDMLFEQTGEGGALTFSVFLEKEDFAIDIPAGAYKQALADFSPLLPQPQKGVFTVVDQTWLMQALVRSTGPN